MIAALIVGGVLLFGGGIATGVSLNKQKTHKIIEEQTQMIGAIQDGQRDLLEAASKPVVLDAELKANLAQVPVQCIELPAETHFRFSAPGPVVLPTDSRRPTGRSAPS